MTRSALLRSGLHLVLVCLVMLGLGTAQARTGQPVVVLPVQGIIGPAVSDYLVRHLAEAARNDAELVIIELDTPGGLDTSMRAIIQEILSSPVPVATFVSPGGARAASAGTFILYASHIAAMTPASNLGAASPVAIGIGGRDSPPRANPDQPDDSHQQPDGDDGRHHRDRADTDGGSAGDRATVPARNPDAMPDASNTNGDKPSAKPDGTDSEGTRQAARHSKPAGLDTLELKATNDAAAYIRSLAQLRGRNAEFAEEAVRDARSLSAREALDSGVIDLIARDIPALLTALEGRQVAMDEETTVALRTAQASVEVLAPDWRTRMLSLLTNPQLALILLMIGIYGLFFELTSPGFAVPGVAGLICLLLGLYAFHMLPVNWAGVALIIAGMLLMIAEVFMPSFGALGIGGIIAFILGGMFLTDTGIPGFDISLSFLIGVAIASAALLLMAGTLIARAHRRTVVTGEQAMIGLEGPVTVLGENGIAYARIRGEQWQVAAAGDLAPGDIVRVTGMRGLVLDVQRVPVDGQ